MTTTFRRATFTAPGRITDGLKPDRFTPERSTRIAESRRDAAVASTCQIADEDVAGATLVRARGGRA